MQVIVKSIHRVGQAIDVIEDFVVQRPIQTIGDVHLVKVLFHMVVRKEGVQGPLVPLQNCWSCFLSHGTYKTQRVWSSAAQHPAHALDHLLSPGLLPCDEIKEIIIQSQSGSYGFFFLMTTTLLIMQIKTTLRGSGSRHLHQTHFLALSTTLRPGQNAWRSYLTTLQCELSGGSEKNTEFEVSPNWWRVLELSILSSSMSWPELNPA